MSVRTERDDLLCAIEAHMAEMDMRALRAGRDRDDIDNDLYNVATRIRELSGPAPDDSLVDFTGRSVKVEMPDGSKAAALGYIVRREDGTLDLMQREGQEFDVAEIASALSLPPNVEEGAPNVLSSEEATAIVSAAFGEDHDLASLDAALKRLGEWVDSQLGLQPTPDDHEGSRCGGSEGNDVSNPAGISPDRPLPGDKVEVARRDSDRILWARRPPSGEWYELAKLLPGEPGQDA